MLLLILAVVVLVGMSWGLFGTLRRAVRVRSIHRHGQRVTGRVSGTETSKRFYYGGVLVAPEVTYRIEDREHTATVLNRADAPDPGSGIDLVVDPKRPSEPIAVFGSTTVTALAASAFGVALGLGLTALAGYDLSR